IKYSEYIGQNSGNAEESEVLKLSAYFRKFKVTHGSQDIERTSILGWSMKKFAGVMMKRLITELDLPYCGNPVKEPLLIQPFEYPMIPLYQPFAIYKTTVTPVNFQRVFVTTIAQIVVIRPSTQSE
ncbi:hypothetical protein TNCV_4465631, partial [Trichonephila clavipes]